MKFFEIFFWTFLVQFGPNKSEIVEKVNIKRVLCLYVVPNNSSHHCAGNPKSGENPSPSFGKYRFGKKSNTTLKKFFVCINTGLE